MKKSFKILLLAESCADFADVLFKVAVISNMYVITHSVIATSSIPVIIGVSTFVSSFFLPVLTRKLRLNEILLYTQFTKTIALTCLFVWMITFNSHMIGVTYSLVTVISLMDGFAGPTSAALIPRYATNLTRANSILTVSHETIEVIGWGIGGVLVLLIGLHQTLMFTVILFWLASLILLYLPQVNIKIVENETPMDSIFKGWKHIIAHRQLKLILGINTFEIIANSIWVSSIILAFISVVLDKSESYWGYINTLYSIGIILGGWGILKFSNAMTQHKPLWIFISLILTALTLALSLIFIDAISFLIATLFIGFFSQLKEIPETILIQESVEEDILVHIYAVMEVLNTLIFSISIFIMSGLAEIMPVQNVFWVTVVLILIEAIIVFIARKQLDT
ncbi:MFS transporter [Staphylococcus delphini]|uniref:MFS transporter n=1 Tax=Staphylococcus delphini TaxID=53344 RepID=UPI0023B34250|nr:MFS transporter [Staphylococcus delphini]MDE9790386.1 MFS transporter [Staphylococcus delphini]MDE9792474.1 MFS transporter [Staphylococcus delphini]MDE9795179.1 MFS transporter [Staphylococcus delphini]MDE9797286.1 MFS transporter [Staphylococcus delphini]MDE9829921.1 MFS transporter [Staphylococcus delphini]